MCKHECSVMSNFWGPRWIVARHTPLSMEFARQKYWRGLPFPTPEDLPNPGIETVSLESPVLAGGFFTVVTSEKPLRWYIPGNKRRVDKAFRQKTPKKPTHKLFRSQSSPLGKPILGRTLSDPLYK